MFIISKLIVTSGFIHHVHVIDLLLLLTAARVIQAEVFERSFLLRLENIANINTECTQTVQEQKIIIADLNKTIESLQKSVEALNLRVSVMENAQNGELSWLY